MLQEYKRKRDFEKTPEPAGATKQKKSAKKQSLSFVIQKHAARRLHYDFRLEVDGVMVSWAVPKGPSLNPVDKRLAVMTEDHPMEYSAFEGIIPEKQYGAGEVIIWDRGTYSPDENQAYSWDDKAEANERMRDGLKRGKLSFYLKGEKLEGSWTLVRLHNSEKEWLLIKHHDQFEDSKKDVTKLDASVVSGQTLEGMQENGAKRIWTSNGEEAADPKSSGKSAKQKSVKKTKAAGASAEIEALIESAKTTAFPKEISPMLATLADAAFNKDGWSFEAKLDGVRAIAYIKNDDLHLSSRRGLDLTEKYPSIAEALTDYSKNLVLDGEVVALDENGKPSFQHLQNAGGLKSFSSKEAQKAHLVYYVFDILYLDGKDLTGLPLTERKQILASVLIESEKVRLVQSLGADGEAAFEACVEHGLEGIVGKLESSKYEKGSRSKSWLKIKTSASDEFLICGYTEGTGSRKDTFGALLLGEFDKQGNLQFVGGVGTGFNGKILTALLKKMEPLETKQCPFKTRPPSNARPTWLKPQLVCEVKYLERTQSNILRAPVYMNLREDIEPEAVEQRSLVHIVESGPKASKSGLATSETDAIRKPKSTPVSKAFPEDVKSVLEQLAGHSEKITLQIGDVQLPVTNLNKTFWPAHLEAPPITKRDYIAYLAKVSQYLIPHLTDRLITLVRFPNGIAAGRFYQKHWEQGLPKFVQTVRVFTEHEKRDQDFLVCNNLPTLLWLGQVADLELHTSHTRINPKPDALELPTQMTGSVKALDQSIANYPDFMVLDLDPYMYSGKEKAGDEPEFHKQGFDQCREAALYLKEQLDALKLKAFLKTSGKTGLHIYIPIKREVDYDTVRSLSEILCRQVLKDHPNDVTMDWAVKKRTGKTFLDHNMNARSKSLASIYSPRVSPAACVSTPIEWDEIETIYPTDFDTHTLPERLNSKGDLWSDILSAKNDLHKAFKGV